MLVVDLGFSGAKWIRGNRRGIIKTCYRKTKSKDGIPFDGERYIVGSRALLETGSHYLRTVEELIRMYPLFVAVCAEKADLEVGREIEGCLDECLVIGLPYDFWKSEMEKSKSAIKSLKETLKDSFGEVLVFPQGLGGVKAYLAQHPETRGNILAIDIGFNTVIYTLYSTEEKEILTGKTFYKKGIHDLAVNKLLPELQKHIEGKTLTPLEIDYIMQTGYIQVGFDRTDVTPEITDAMEAYVNDLFELIIGDLKAHGGVITFEKVVLFGGGARYVKEKVSSDKVDIVILDDPEFANAVGFEIRGREVMGYEV